MKVLNYGTRSANFSHRGIKGVLPSMNLMPLNSIIFILLSIFITMSAKHATAQVPSLDTIAFAPQYTNPIIAANIDPHFSALRQCDDTYSIHIGVMVSPIYDRSTKTYRDARYLEFRRGEQQVIYMQGGPYFSATEYNYQTTVLDLEYTLIAYDDFGSIIGTKIVTVDLREREELSTTNRVLKHVLRWQEYAGTNGMSANGGPSSSNIFTYFCGVEMDIVEVLAFLQGYLDLSREEACKFMSIYYSYQNASSTSLMTGSTVTLDCPILEDIYEKFLKDRLPPVDDDDDDDPGSDDGTGGGGGNNTSSDCTCNTIKSSTSVDHSVGATASGPTEDCGDISYFEDDLYWGRYAEQDLGSRRNWVNILWGYSGASKTYNVHSVIDKNPSGYIKSQEEGGDGGITRTLGSGNLRSSIQFAFSCYDPEFATIDTTCDCTKTVVFAGRYDGRVRASSQTSPSGSLELCMDDFAFITRGTNTSAEVIDGGGVAVCISCDGQDSTNIFTDLGTLSNVVIEAATSTNLIAIDDSTGQISTNFDVSRIGDYFNAAGNVVDVFNQNFGVGLGCGKYKDTTYVLTAASDAYRLSTADNYVVYTVTSYLNMKHHVDNDDARSDMLISGDYWLAGRLYAEGDEEICCTDEQVASYSIGTLNEIENDNLGQAKFNRLFQVRPLDNQPQRYQRDVANHFGRDIVQYVFGQDPCCVLDVPCYYQCGLYGKCHEADPRSNEVSDSPLSQLEAYPNPTSDVLQIRILGGTATDAVVHLIGVAGEIVKTVTLSNDTAVEVDVQGLPPGLYLLTSNNISIDPIKVMVYD